MKTKQWEQPIDAEGNPVEEAAVDATNELVAATTRNEDLFLVIALNDLAPSPTNPRRHFDESTLAELAGSVKTRGIIQPIVVRPAGLKFEIVAGERRYRAAQLAGLTEAPCIVRELSDGDVLEIQVIENAQRDDVHPLEECEGFRRILDSGIYGTGQEAIKTLASKISMSPSHVYARLKLVDLSKDAQAEFLAGNISMGHAIQIARLDPVGQMKAITATLWENRYNGAALADRGARKESPLSVRDLAYWIAREITRDLSKAPWDRLDAQLLPQAGSCAACPKQTGVENLLGESEGDSRCLDPGCFKAKEQAFTALKLKESIAANPGAEKISTKHYDTSKNLLSPASYSIVKKETPGAVPAIIAETGDHDSEKVGEIAYIRLFRTSSSGQKIPPIEERRERLEELRLQRAENLARFRI